MDKMNYWSNVQNDLFNAGLAFPCELGPYRFIGYWVDASGTKSVPAATGRTREETFALVAQRALATCTIDGSLAVQDRTLDVNEATFVQLTQFLNMHFIEVDRMIRGDA